MAKYRVAVIGHTGRGDYGHGIDTVWERLPDRCELVAVADADPQGLSRAAAKLKAPQAFADYRKMLDEVRPSIVGIGPRWLDQHREMVIAAAERGIHVFMEKPFCRCPAEADEIIAALDKHHVKLALAHQTRYSPKLQVVRDMILDGQLGKILELRGRGKEDARGGGEDLWVLGSHVMNLIHYFGGSPHWCFADVQQDGKPVTPKQVREGNEQIGLLAGDQVNAVYGMEEGAIATFGSHKNAAGNRFGLQIYGSKGVIEILTGYLPAAHFLADPMWSPGRSKAAWVPISSAGLAKPEPLTDGSAEAGNQAAIEDLIGAIEMDREPECSAYEGRQTIEMICAVFESHRKNRPVPMPLATRTNPLQGWSDS